MVKRLFLNYKNLFFGHIKKTEESTKRPHSLRQLKGRERGRKRSPRQCRPGRVSLYRRRRRRSNDDDDDGGGGGGGGIRRLTQQLIL